MTVQVEDISRVYECRWNTPEFVSRMNEVIQIGRRIFAGSAIVIPGQPFTQHEIDFARKFLIQAVPNPKTWPITGEDWNKKGGPAEHIALCGAIAGEITTQLCSRIGMGTLSPEKMIVVGLLHDLGRLVSHEFYATDLLSDILARFIGLNPAILNATHKIDWYWKTDEPLNFDEISAEQRISVIADVLSKRHSKHRERMRRPNELLDDVKQGKQKYMRRPPTNGFDYRM